MKRHGKWGICWEIRCLFVCRECLGGISGGESAHHYSATQICKSMGLRLRPE